MKSWHGGFSLHRIASSPWQKSALFAVSIVGRVCDRAFFLELTKCGRSQTAPTVGSPSLRLLPRAASRAGEVTDDSHECSVSQLHGHYIVPVEGPCSGGL